MKTWESMAREHLRSVLTDAVLSVTPQTVMRERVTVKDGTLRVVDGTELDLTGFGHVRLAAVGKAAPGMAAQTEGWTTFTDTLVVTPDPVDLTAFNVMVADHPVPTARSVDAGRRLLEMAEATGPDDLMILLLSGGGSALAEVPAVSLEDVDVTNRLLLKAAVPIHEVNAVRKHLSRVKGGRLAEACRGRLLVLSISDVAEDDASAIASGPAAPDPTTFRDAVAVLERHGLWDQVPEPVRGHLGRGVDGELPETPKPGDPRLARASNHVLAGNERALERAARAAEALGYRAVVLPEALRGEARARGRDLAALARQALEGDEDGTLKAALSTAGGAGADVTPPCAFILGGETVVHVTGTGKGGRNQELALAAVHEVSGRPILLAGFGTDGVDGPTDAAGAVVDGLTLARAREAGLDPDAHLEENDAYPFFDALDDLIRTGPSGTNVRDVAVALVGRPGGRVN